MMTQTRLPFQYQIAKNTVQATGFAGLFLYLELAYASGLCQRIQRDLTRKQQGWSELQMILSLLLLNIAGGNSVEDIERLAGDPGLCVLLERCEQYGLKRLARQRYERRWRRGKPRALPSCAALHRYLQSFHRPDQEAWRVKGEAFIPASSESLERLSALSEPLIACLQAHHPSRVATLDQDATLCATQKRTALYCYKKYKAYHPMNVYWYEQGVLLYSELRDGNVPASYDSLRVFKEALARLPQDVTDVYWRSDTAGYQQELLGYCSQGTDSRFGVIQFAVGVVVSQAFKTAALEVPEAAWHPVVHIEPDGQRIATKQSWAEVFYLPIWMLRKQEPEYRFIAIREPVHEPDRLLKAKPGEKSHRFQTIDWPEGHYKVFGIVTNRHTLPGNDLIHWYRGRCGDSERVHSIQKRDLAGGRFPSGQFGANAAWWQLVVLAFNLNALMQRHVFPKKLRKSRLKALRFELIHLPGRVIHHARRWILTVYASTPLSRSLHRLRHCIMELALPPPALQNV